MENNSDARTRRTAADRRHSVTRERLLRELETRGPARIAELAAATGLHENTVREHLDRLQADGHARRELEPPAGRGRPAMRWHAVDPEAANPYAGLAATLADTLDAVAADPPGAARIAGAAWGARLVEDRAEPPDPRALVVDIMREQGFAPSEGDTGRVEVDDPRDADLITLRRCPLLAAAARHPQVVCAAHEGMIRGILGTRGAHARVDLEPFASDGTCRLRVRVAS